MKVRFSCTVNVHLIPSTKDYGEENLHSLLWWTIADYSFFKQSATAKIEIVLKCYPLLNASAAIKLLDSFDDDSGGESCSFDIC